MKEKILYFSLFVFSRPFMFDKDQINLKMKLYLLYDGFVFIWLFQNHNKSNFETLMLNQQICYNKRDKIITIDIFFLWASFFIDFANAKKKKTKQRHRFGATNLCC